MSQQQENRPTPQDYADTFETNKTGERILEHLIQVFGRPPKGSGGIDRILDSHEHIGSMKVLNFIVNQINRANGVPVDDNPEEGGSA